MFLGAASCNTDITEKIKLKDRDLREGYCECLHNPLAQDYSKKTVPLEYSETFVILEKSIGRA